MGAGELCLNLRFATLPPLKLEVQQRDLLVKLEGMSRTARTVTPVMCGNVRDGHRTGSGGDGHDDEEPTSVCGKRLAALRFLAVCGSIE
jgi:hypothetical protein